MSAQRDKHLISGNISVLRALERLESIRGGTLFIVDSRGVLQGSITDGDIRRALLSERVSLESNCIEASNRNPYVLRAGELPCDLDAPKDFQGIPVLDRRGHVLNLLWSTGKESLSIGSSTLTSARAPLCIAEIGNNHNGDLDRGKRLVELAKSSGASAVKFQFRCLDALYGTDPITNDIGVEYTRELLEEVNLPTEAMAELISFAKESGLLVGCTPFDHKALSLLGDFDLDFIKIASADLTNSSLLTEASKFYKPLIVSTGMSDIEEIERASLLLKRSLCPFALLHCNSTYPTPFKDVGLNFMPTLKELTNTGLYGYSGHERGVLRFLSLR